MGIILSHCDNYPLISKKRIDFENFKKAAILIKAKAHLKDEGFKEILSIRSAMYLGLSNALALAFPEVVPIDNPIFSAKDLAIQNPYWVSGFTSPPLPGGPPLVDSPGGTTPRVVEMGVFSFQLKSLNLQSQDMLSRLG